MLCTNCRKEIPDDSSFCCYCGMAQSKSESNIGTENVKVSKQAESIGQEAGPTWGMFINRESYHQGKFSSCPKWAKQFQREKWESRGLIIWDQTASQITRLWAGQAIKLLNDMKESDGRKGTGVTVGEPAFRIHLDKPSNTKRKSKKEPPTKPEEDKWVLTDTIDLTVIQTAELFEFLQRNEKLLLEIAQDEEKERSRRISEAYRILLGDEVWNALGSLYQINPEEALKLGMEAVRTALGKEEKNQSSVYTQQ